jgi:hypothetical protein
MNLNSMAVSCSYNLLLTHEVWTLKCHLSRYLYFIKKGSALGFLFM